MKHKNSLSRGLLLGLALAACMPAVFADTPLDASSTAGTGTKAIPGDSIYQLAPHLTDQDGKPFALASARGGPVLISMFYSSCEMVCPVLFETIAQTLKELPPATRDRLKIVMITFDPARDTLAVLKDTADKHHCDKHWSLVRGKDAEVRQIAALLGVQYRRLPSGEFNHSSAILLLDGDGRVVMRSGRLGTIDPALVEALIQVR
ncbi:MAG: SCO family protein [Burkholderiaceae bacterium]|jgi:protein SCO1/2